MQCYRSRVVWWLTLEVALFATMAWAHPAKVTSGPAQITCGPALHGCGPSVVVTSTGGTTTTTAAPIAAPSWVPSTLAAWMLDEASGQTRVNAQGTTGRNMTEGNGAIANNTTTKQQGAASLDLPGGTKWLGTTDATLETLPQPFTCGVWARSGTTTSSHIMRNNSTSPSNGFDLQLFSGGSFDFVLWTANASNDLSGSVYGLNTWVHLAVWQSGTTSKLYNNGAVAAQATRTYSPPSAGGTLNPFSLGAGAASFTGQVDEAWCIASALADASICRICSCGLDGALCACSGTAYTSTGRNAASCGSCALPACNATTPP